MKRGVTLAELLVVIVIIGIVSVGLITAYRQVFTRSAFTAATAKDEQSAQIFIDQIIRDIHSIGFGMWNNPGRPGSIHKIGNIGCGGLANFATGDQGFLAIAENCQGENGDELYFFSLTARDFINAGCWGIVEANGCLRVDSANYLGSQCDGNIFFQGNQNTQLPNIALSPAKAYAGYAFCQNNCSCKTCTPSSNCQNALPGTMVFFKGSAEYSKEFATRYFLEIDGNQPRTCAPNTFTLYKQVYPDNPQPVLSCIGAFKVRYVLNNNGVLSYVDSTSSSPPNLVGIRLCIMIQIGTEASLEQNVPTFTNNCGNITVDNAWRRYRWKLVEVDIPIRNR